jgi:hypothetical protein
MHCELTAEDRVNSRRKVETRKAGKYELHPSHRCIGLTGTMDFSLVTSACTASDLLELPRYKLGAEHVQVFWHVRLN